MPKKIWTIDKIAKECSKVLGLSRKEAKELGFEKEWFAVYRHNKELLLKVKDKTYNMLSIMKNQEILEYTFKVAVYSLIKSRGIEFVERYFNKVIASYIKYNPLHK